VSVDPDFRGRGFGRAIMEAAESWLVERGVWKLNLMVRAENTTVVEFYNSIGYEPEKRLNFGKWIEPG
jgi:ribosomal protein S18 acetylase RimI-like enzyme